MRKLLLLLSIIVISSALVFPQIKGTSKLGGTAKGGRVVTGGASPNLLTNFTLGTPVSAPGNQSFGVIVFTNVAATPTFTSLCRWKISGNSQTHTIYLVEASPFSILRSTTVDMSTGSVGTWICSSITPYTTASQVQYGILSEETTAGDQIYGNVDTTFTGVFSSFTNPIVGNAYSTGNPPTNIFTWTSGNYDSGIVNAIVTP